MARIKWPGLEGHTVDTETGRVYAPSGDFTGHTDSSYAGKWAALEKQLNDTATNYQYGQNEAQGYTAQPTTGYDLQKDFYGPGKHALFDLSGKGPPPGMPENVRYVSPKEAQDILARGELESKGENLKYAIMAAAGVAGGYAAFGGAPAAAAAGGLVTDPAAAAQLAMQEFGGTAASGVATSGFAPDAIQKMIEAVNSTGSQTASEAAQKLGHSSMESYLGSINPAWVNTAANAINPMTGLPNEQAPAPVETRTPVLTGGVGTALGTAAAASPLLKTMQDLGLLPSNSQNLLGGLLGIGSGLYGLDRAGDFNSVLPGGAGDLVAGGPGAIAGSAGTGAQRITDQAARSAAELRAAAAKAAADADPWGISGGREIASSQLRALLQDPSSITTQPGYKAGLEAVQRSMAAQGYQGSGNMMAALHKYGGDFYDKALAQLAVMSGATVNPATAAQLGLQGQTSAAQLETTGATSAAQLGTQAQIEAARLAQLGRTDAAKINMAGQIASNDLASRSLASIGYGATRTVPALEAFTKGVFS